jgi:hypothetical protein
MSATGFADDSWWQRTSQMYTTAAGTGFGWYMPNSVVPSGRVIALDGDNVVGFGRTVPYSPFDNFAGLNLTRYRIFSMPRKPVVKRTQYETVDWGERIKERTQDAAMHAWSRDVAVRARALLVAGDKMVLAGPRNVLYGVKPKSIEQGRRVIRGNVDAFTGMADGLDARRCQTGFTACLSWLNSSRWRTFYDHYSGNSGASTVEIAVASERKQKCELPDSS